MFTCNNLTLLIFTYHLKLFLGICMTIIPFIFLELTFIKFVKYKEKHKKINKYILKKQIKNLEYIIIVFVFALTLHNCLNRDANVCYVYSNKYVLKEYTKTYKSLENKNISENDRKIQLENSILSTYNISKNNNKSNLTTLNSNNVEKTLDSNNVEKTDNKNDNFNLNETDYKKINNVYVVDGVFYYPQYRSGNWYTYSGTACSNNLTQDGYNNPYGYNNYFYTRLVNFIDAANKNGYKITFSTQGCRNYDTQVYYYNTMTRGRAATPGHSLHGFGIASDLEFYLDNGNVCGYGRNSINCPSMGWAHENAHKYGLIFPLLHASYKEDWHIEPTNKNKY